MPAEPAIEHQYGVDAVDARHAEQDVAQAAVLSVAGHGVHVVVPSAILYVLDAPAAQRHTPDFAGAHSPVGHGVHDVARPPEEKVFAAQSLHTPFAMNLPGLHDFTGGGT